MPTDILFSPYQLGRVVLKNRVVMAPMTRSRCPGNLPSELVTTYYRQRAEAGLIVTEGTSPSPNGLGYPRIPGLFRAEHVTAWKHVTSAVHQEQSRIFVQLMHTGRVSQVGNLPHGARVVAPSAVAYAGDLWVDPDGHKPASPPEAMTEADIETALEEYAHGAALAIEAGFDGVELHGANGYLIDQFLNTATNQRTDGWGGSIAGRIRFAVEATRRVAQRISADRVGIRLSPYGVFNGMVGDPEHEQVCEAVVQAVGALRIAYVHLVDHSAMGAPAVPDSVKQKIRAAFGGTLILSGGYDRARAEADLQEHKGELVAFGRPFISNPRLVSKLKNQTPLVPQDFSTFYTPGAKGYTDYPLD